MEIKKLLTPINCEFADRRKEDIEYIVIHYVGRVSTAGNNALYFARNYVGASAHYFIDDRECLQVVDEKDIAWHCGVEKGGTYKHPYARNYNSIGIEMCCLMDEQGNLYISDETVKNTIIKVREIMKKYNLSIDRVLRHYDVTWKLCPAPWCGINIQRWYDFLDELEEIEEMENWEIELGEKSIDSLIEKGFLHDPSWKNRLGESVPVWLFYAMLDRLADSGVKNHG